MASTKKDCTSTIQVNYYHQQLICRNKSFIFFKSVYVNINLMLSAPNLSKVTQDAPTTNTLEALMIEVEHVHRLPWAVPLFNSLKTELKSFKLIADRCDITMDSWEFWRTYYLSLPIWYKVAEEVVLVMVSSASVERVFSLLNHSFDDHQQNSLQDYKEASVRLRYNENWRTKYD